jgi:hypothetical protein
MLRNAVDFADELSWRAATNQGHADTGPKQSNNSKTPVLQACTCCSIAHQLQSCSAHLQDGQQADNSQEEVNDDADTPWAALLDNSTCMQGVRTPGTGGGESHTAWAARQVH